MVLVDRDNGDSAEGSRLFRVFRRVVFEVSEDVDKEDALLLSQSDTPNQGAVRDWAATAAYPRMYTPKRDLPLNGSTKFVKVVTVAWSLTLPC